MGALLGEAGVEKHFRAALDALIERVKQDRAVLAAVLCGSMSHDTVWSKSDIDLALITIDDKKLETTGLALYADGVNVHAFLFARSDFRRIAEGAIRNSFAHTMFAKGRLLYTHDESIATLMAGLQHIGERDAQTQLLAAGTSALGPIYKAHKWFRTRGDLDYTSLWILYAANALARIEVMEARRLADREVLPQAMELNPAFFSMIYRDVLNTKKSAAKVEAVLAAIDGYLEERAAVLFAPVLAYLEEAGEARSAGEIDHYFEKNWGIQCASAACEYLADLGRIGKVSLPVRLTKRSTVAMEELAFVYPGEGASDVE